MKKKYIFILFCFINFLNMNGQFITMSFPKFAGKSYDFIIFQGSEQKTIIKGIIPEDGNFVLFIPNENLPYIGMSRWLITGTKEGGGLDMYIPGHDFSVSCLSNKPNDENIVYNNNDGNKEINKLYKEKKRIVNRYELMRQAIMIFDQRDKHYKTFEDEIKTQKRSYNSFQKILDRKSDYISQLVRIVNITEGLGTQLLDNKNDKANNICIYISEKLNWDYLYTSGYWYGIISTWVYLHIRALNDINRFKIEYNLICSKMSEQDYIYNFTDKVVRILKEENMTNYLDVIKNSNKSLSISKV